MNLEIPDRDADRPSAARGSGFRVSWELTIGAILQAALVAVGLIAWAVSGSNKSDELQRELSQLQRTVAELNAQVCAFRTVPR